MRWFVPLLSLCLVSAWVGAALAQPPAGTRTTRLERYAERFDLTPEQRDQLAEIWRDKEAETRALRDRVRAEGSRMVDKKGELTAIREKSDARIEAMLEPEQVEAFRAFRKERKDNQRRAHERDLESRERAEKRRQKAREAREARQRAAAGDAEAADPVEAAAEAEPATAP